MPFSRANMSLFGLIVVTLMLTGVMTMTVHGEAAEAAEASDIPTPAENTSSPDGQEQTLLSRALWYFPNRVFDLADIFRLRLKVGPGLGVTARATDFAAFYAGYQKTAFVGLPGPRYPGGFRPPYGLEYQRGLVMAGVDASDEMLHPPRYGFSEVDVGVHLGLIGAEFGLDPFELADFLAGWFFLDLRSDDAPRTRAKLPERGRVMSRQLAQPGETGEEIPAAFPDTTARLDYLKREVPERLQREMQALDARFAGEGEPVIVHPPMDELTLGFFVRSLVGEKTEVELKPDFNLDVELPNLQRRVSLFVESASGNDLPGRDNLEREDKGWTVGARSKKNPLNISTDVGVRAKWLPEVFVRAAWKPSWHWGAWQWFFEQRVFWESDDGFGQLQSLQAHRWLRQNQWFYRQSTSGKLTETSDGYEWEQSFAAGRALTLFDETRRQSQRRIGVADVISGYSLRAIVFGGDDNVTQYRLLGAYRFDLYRQFVIGDVRAGPQWREEQGWGTEGRVGLGIEVHF